MKPLIHRLLALGLLLGASLTASLRADDTSPMFAGYSFADTSGNTYTWDSASEDGTWHYDTYSGPYGAVTVTGMIGYPNLATVSGSGVDGHLENGIYGHNYWESGVGGSSYWEYYQYTVDFLVGELYWIHNTSANDFAGNESSSWDDSHGEWGSWQRSTWSDGWNYTWSESWDSSASGPGSRSGGSSQSMGPGSDVTLFGMTFTFWSESSSWEQGSDGTDYGSTDISYSSGDGSLEVSNGYNNLTGYAQTTVSGSDPYIGYFHGTLSGAPVDLNAVTWDPRTAPSFAPSQFWIDGWLVSWQGGALSSDGTVVDTYSGDLFGVTLTGYAREFGLGNATAALAVNGTAAGTVNLEGTWSLTGWTVSTSEPQQTSTTEPYFLPTASSLYVAGAEYPFVGSYTGSGDSRVDVYVNASLGTVRLSGQTAGTAHVAGNSGTSFFEGSLTNGAFGATVPVSVMVSATPPPPAFEPGPLWVGGVYFGTRVLDAQQLPTNTFINADGTASLSFTAGSAPGEWVVHGVDGENQPTFSGTLTSMPDSVFMLAATQGGAFPAMVVGTGGVFQGIGGTQEEIDALEAASLPLAVSANTVVLEYLGTTADDAVPSQQVAWYVRREAASATRLMKITQGGNGAAAVTLTDYSSITATVSAGTYDPATYLFQTGSTASLPSPLFSADPTAGHIRVLLARADATLPASFVVRGQSWWYAGTDGAGNARYQGFYNNQLMSVGTADANGQRLVTLNDPLHNDGSSTSGTLSSERKSVRLRDGTLVLSGDEQGNSVVVQHEDDFKLHTIAADLDIVGNNLSFGILEGDASLSGALFQFADQDGRASLHSILSRPAAQWGWWKAEGLDGDTLRPVMWLGSDHKLNLYRAGGYDAPAIVLDPAGTSSFQGPVRVPQSGDIPMGIYQEGDPP